MCVAKIDWCIGRNTTLFRLHWVLGAFGLLRYYPTAIIILLTCCTRRNHVILEAIPRSGVPGVILSPFLSSILDSRHSQHSRWHSVALKSSFPIIKYQNKDLSSSHYNRQIPLLNILENM